MSLGKLDFQIWDIEAHLKIFPFNIEHSYSLQVMIPWIHEESRFFVILKKYSYYKGDVYCLLNRGA